jgi:hypothetical protein
VLGPEADRLLAVACAGDASAWWPLADALEEQGQGTLASFAREVPGRPMLEAYFFVRMVTWLGQNYFDRETMEVVVQMPPFSVERHWIAWKSIATGLDDDSWRRVAIVARGGRR